MPRKATHSPFDMREGAQREDTERSLIESVRREEQGQEEPHIWTTQEGRKYSTLAEMIFAELRGDWSSDSEISDREHNLEEDEPPRSLPSTNIFTDEQPHESISAAIESSRSSDPEPSPDLETARVLARHPSTSSCVSKTVGFNLIPSVLMPETPPPTEPLPSRPTATPLPRLVPTMTVDELNAIWKRERSPPPGHVHNHYCEFWQPGDPKDSMKPKCNKQKTYTKYDINPFTKEGRAHKAKLEERDKKYRKSRSQHYPRV